MMSEEEERPKFVTGSYGRHRRQWVNRIRRAVYFKVKRNMVYERYLFNNCACRNLKKLWTALLTD